MPQEDTGKELEQEHLGEFQLAGEEKKQYLANADEALRLLGRSDIQAKEELSDIRAFLGALGENTDPLFESIAFDREDSGFPTYWQVIGFLGQKRNVLKRLDRINSKIEHELSSRPFYEEPRPGDRGTLSELIDTKMSRNAELLVSYAKKCLFELLEGTGYTGPREVVEDLASIRSKAMFYEDIFRREHLVDADLEDTMKSREGELPPPWTLMKVRMKKKDWNPKFVKWHASLGIFDAESGLFLKYGIDLCVKAGAVSRYVAQGGKPTRELTNLLEVYAGLEPEDIYDHLIKHKDLDPVDISLVTIGPFYSGPHAHSEGMVPETLLDVIRSNPDDYLLMSTVRTVRRARRDLGSIFYSKPLFGEDQGAERTARLPVMTRSYFVTSPGLEPLVADLLASAPQDGKDTIQLYDSGGETFVRIR